MTDRTTKLLLAIIALGLWAHLLLAVAPPVEAQSLSDTIRQDAMLDVLKGIKSDTSLMNSTLSTISTDTVSMRTNLNALVSNAAIRRR